jgi:hypothetical protein
VSVTTAVVAGVMNPDQKDYAQSLGVFVSRADPGRLAVSPRSNEA